MARRRPTSRIVKLASPLDTEKTVLGLDCSSSTIGWGLVRAPDPKLLSYGHIKPIKSDKFLMIRLLDVKEKISALCKELSPDYVAVEDIMLFVRNRSTAKTITVLTAFNRAASLAAYEELENKDLRYYSVHEIRKTIKDKYLDKKSKVGKEDMPDLIRDHLNDKFNGPINTRGDIATETLDEADGIAVAWCCAIILGDE